MMTCFGLCRRAKGRKPSQGESDSTVCAALALPLSLKESATAQTRPAASSVEFQGIPFRSTQEWLQLLCTLQREIGDLQSNPMEGRASNLVNMLLTSLSASAVRLYCLSDERHRGGSAALVLLAAASSPSAATGMNSPDEGCLGQSLELPLDTALSPISPQRLTNAAASARSHKESPPSTADLPTLLHRAITSMEPALHPAPPVTLASGGGGGGGDDSGVGGVTAKAAVAAPEVDSVMRINALPGDCLYDYTTHESTKFVALPLRCGTQLLGVLWISAAGGGGGSRGSIGDGGIGGGGGGGVRAGAATSGIRGLPTAVRQLLSSQEALQQLSLSASVALSCNVAGPDGQPYICWLATMLGHLAGSSTLQALVSELTVAIEEHVRQRYLLELAVRAALVPSSASNVAYMLSYLTPAVLSPAAAAAAAAGTSQLVAATQTPTRPRRGHLAPFMDQVTTSNNFKGRRDGMATICSLGTGGGGGGGGGGGALAENLGAEGSGASATAVTTTPSASLGSLGPAAARGGKLLKSGLRSCDSQDAFNRNPSTRAQYGMHFRQTAADMSSAAGGMTHLKPAAGSSSSVTAAAQQQQLHDPQQPQLEPAIMRTPLQAQQRVATTSPPIRTGGGAVGIADAAFGELALALAARGSTAQSMGEVGAILTGGMSSTGATFHSPGLLRAKAFKLSHTLLQRLIEGGGGSGGDGGATSAVSDSLSAGKYGSSDTTHTVSGRKGNRGSRHERDGASPLGFIISSCARWVQDVRHPSRDLCLLMLAGSGSRNGGGHVGSDGAPGPASGSANSVKSLVLLCLEVSRGAGIFLSLYLTFPSQLPVPLLEAVRDSCGELLHRIFGRVVQMKLREDLSAEVDTLRLGVPGSYAVLPSFMMSNSFSRDERDRMDPDTMSCGGPSTLGTTGLVTAPMAAAGGEVRPPGRLAKTVTMTQLEVGTTGFLSGHSSFEENLCTADTTGLGTDGDVIGNMAPDLVSDLEFNIDVSALKARSQRSVATPAIVATTGARMLHAAADATSRASRGSLFPVVQGLSLSALLPAASSGTGRGGATARLHRGAGSAMSGPASIVPMLLGTTGNVSVAGSVRIMDQSLSGDLLQTVTADFGSIIGAGAPTAASVLTVQEADAAGSMRAHFGLLVESLMGSIRSTTAPTPSMASPEGASNATSTAPFTASSSTRATYRSIGASVGNPEDLEEIQLYDILGEGASGVVLRGVMGTVPVATKLIEIPHVEEHVDDKQRAADTADNAPTAKAAKDHLSARHTMYRNAMELAVLKSTTHVNIVQCLGVFDNVYLEHMQNSSGARGCVLRRASAAIKESPSGSPLCTAIVTELCDNCLSSVLADKTFPRVISAAVSPGRSVSIESGSGGGGASERNYYKYDMKGVYLTILEIALALRHLHSRRLVHRDLKPANVLLKNSQSDPRGWTSKLADFGFTQLLDRQEWRLPDNNNNNNNNSGGGGGVVGGAGGRTKGTPTGGSVQRTGSSACLFGTTTSSGGSNVVMCAASGVNICYTIQEQACGTVTHMAPEAMRPNAKIDGSVDIYALGIVMWDIIAGRGYRPYRDLQPEQIPSAVMGGMRPAFPDWVPTPYRKLAQSCWSAEPHRRPTAAEVVTTVKSHLELMHVHQQVPGRSSHSPTLSTASNAAAVRGGPISKAPKNGNSCRPGDTGVAGGTRE